MNLIGWTFYKQTNHVSWEPFIYYKSEVCSKMSEEGNFVHKIDKKDLIRLVGEFQIEKIRNPNNQSLA